jgi:hypothetical protein
MRPERSRAGIQREQKNRQDAVLAVFLQAIPGVMAFPGLPISPAAAARLASRLA